MPASLRIQLPDRREAICPADRSTGTVFGRHTMCDVVLDNPHVSSKHFSIFAADPTGSTWFLNDLKSRHGVTINGARVPVGVPTPIRAGDWIGAGPAIMRVLEDGARADRGVERRSAATLIDGPSSRVVSPAAIALGLTELQHISRISAARTREELCEELLTCVLTLTGHARAAIAQISGHEDRAVELIASRASSPSVKAVDSISRSLVNAALASGVAVFDDRAGSGGMSIIQSLIHAACCVRMSNTPGQGGPVWVLYLDSRDQESRPHGNATDIASALANVAAACMGRLSAAELHERHTSLQTELQRARSIQKMLQPPADGMLAGGGFRFQIRSLPGQVVAGDLVDVIELDATRAAIVIGDVMGKGAPAGMLMSAIQAQLSQGLRDGVDFDKLVMQINRDTLARCPGVIVSLWVGVVDASTMRLRYVNAGHGLCLLRDENGQVRVLDEAGGPILGADVNAEYKSGDIALGPSSRLVLFTDGLVEQADINARQLGMPSVIECVERCTDGSRQSTDIHTMLDEHASGQKQVDDVTLLVIEAVAGSR